MNLKLPKLIGHRGVKDLAPENTVASINKAIQFGLKWVEIDVKISKDLKPFLLHDDFLDRTTSGKGNPINYSYESIQKMNAGKWFDKKYNDIYPPSLEEILSICSNKNIGVNIELKPNKNYEKENVLSIYNVVKKYKTKYFFSSFDLDSVILLKNLDNSFVVSFLVDKIYNYKNLDKILLNCKKHDFFLCSFNINLITKKLISMCKSYEILIGVYSSSNIDLVKANYLWELGVDTIFIDNPKTYKKILEKN